MSRQNDTPMSANEGHFQYSLPQGRNNNGESLVTLAPGSVTIRISSADEQARQELRGLEAVNNTVLGNKTACSAGTDNSFALTAVTSNPSTDALFMVGHLANTGVFRRGAKDMFEKALIDSGQLAKEGPPAAEATQAPAPGLHAARLQASQIQGTSQGIHHSSSETMNPVQDKAATPRGAERQNNGRGLA